MVALLADSADAFFGLKWTVVHLVEASTGWPSTDFDFRTTHWRRLLGGRIKKQLRGDAER